MTPTYIAIIGIDADRKHRAAKFKSKDLEAVTKVADSMKLCVANPKTPAAMKLVAALPAGKLAGDKTVVPVFKGKWDPLWSAFAPEPQGEASPIENLHDRVLWPALKIGSVVIAPEILPSDNGWWKAEVIGVKGDSLVLKWLDNPRQAPTTMPREQVAILHPKFL